MFSEMLHELDRNTTHYMVDDMKEKIEQQGETIADQKAALEAQETEIKRLLENQATNN